MNIDAYAEFTDEKVKILNMFIAEQRRNFAENQDMIHPGYLEGFNYFFGDGFDPADFFEKLKKIGWEIRIVDDQPCSRERQKVNRREGENKGTIKACS